MFPVNRLCMTPFKIRVHAAKFNINLRLSACQCMLLSIQSQYIHITGECNSKNSSDGQKIELSKFPLEKIRNFSIIAHIDHGKSTLADRILEFTGAISKKDSNEQVLDKLQVEKERGITVKAQSASIIFRHKDEDYLLNLVDTPGHVDFSYEVERSLAACQGVILLIDANQGVQAQTVSNFFLAFTKELTIIPVLNKVDLKNAQPEIVMEQLMSLFDIDPDDVLKVSAKFGTGIAELLAAVVEKVPSPAEFSKTTEPLRTLLFDSWYDRYKGVICQLLVVDGILKKGDFIQSSFTKKSYEVKDVSYLSPEEVPVDKLYTGQIGVISAGIRDTSEARVGDTFHLKGTDVVPLRGFREPKPMVYAGIYPVESKDQLQLKAAVERLALNDSSVTISIETSEALGLGWRVGFLGLLHMEVFNTRLEQEHGASVVVSTPSVPYKIKKSKVVSTKRKGKNKLSEEIEEEELIINNPILWPENTRNIEMFEPIVKATIISPDTYLMEVTRLCESNRGEQLDMQDLGNSRIIMTYKFPLNEIVVDFFDSLKSVTSGYATFDYEDAGYEPSDLVKVGIKLNGESVQELSSIIHRSQAESRGRKMCLRLVETLPRQLFKIAVQAVIGSKVIARENIKAVRKDVLAKCYGGDVSRKMKLLKRQAEGKKRMKMVGNIEIPRDCFINILKK